MQMGMPGQGQVNVNTMAIRPLLQNVSVVALFVLPLITMRTYSEEKRSGTIELLLTSPAHRLPDHHGQVFRRRRALRPDAGGHAGSTSASCSFTAIPNGSRFVTGYLGLLLMGASFMSIGLLISSLTKNQIVAGMVTFAVLLLLWTVSWMSESAGPMMQKVLTALSITDHFDDFSKGVIALSTSSTT